MVEQMLNRVATILAIDDLKRNRQPVKLTMLPSVGLLFAPGILFVGLLLFLKETHVQFAWLNDLGQYPWQLWTIGLFGSIATLGGVGDWLFHRIYVTVGPREHDSHLLALGSGGVVFMLMAVASVWTEPLIFLIPILVALITTVALICYDEFAFHIHRCKPFETMLHRMLVFGNGAAFLCWFHWLFVNGGVYGT